MAGRTMLSRRVREQPVTGRLVHGGDRRITDLGRDPVTFGRGPEGVTVVLPGARVSRCHAGPASRQVGVLKGHPAPRARGASSPPTRVSSA